MRKGRLCMSKLIRYIKATVLVCLLISGASAAKLFSGKTVNAYNVIQGYWFKAYFDPNGRIHEIHDIGGDRQGKWRIDKRGRKCVQWIEGQEFCNILVYDGKVCKEIITIKNEQKHIVTFEKFTEGNPDNL
jgi:hypothetical protein